MCGGDTGVVGYLGQMSQLRFDPPAVTVACLDGKVFDVILGQLAHA